jgi:hypothetical protein
MRTQASKSQLSQYGEFSVAAELNRRGFSATVTYGNMKNTDVVTFSEHGHYIVVEVKTSSTNRFITGITPQKIVQKSLHVFWVLVSAKQDQKKASPRFFILSDSEIKEIQDRSDKEYLSRYKAKHRKDYSGIGVPSFSIKELASYEDSWSKIDHFLETKQRG